MGLENLRSIFKAGFDGQKEEFQENSNTAEKKTTDNPLFVDGKWNIVKELTPQEVMKIIEEKQKAKSAMQKLYSA